MKCERCRRECRIESWSTESYQEPKETKVFLCFHCWIISALLDIKASIEKIEQKRQPTFGTCSCGSLGKTQHTDSCVIWKTDKR